jgi:coatomer protein complex subunit alpha (xenin)
VFVARNRYAILYAQGGVTIKSLDSSNAIRHITTPPAKFIFPASTGNCLVSSEDQVLLLDSQLGKVTNTLPVAHVKYVFWSADSEYVALASKHALTIANKRLEHQCVVSGTSPNLKKRQ